MITTDCRPSNCRHCTCTCTRPYYTTWGDDTYDTYYNMSTNKMEVLVTEDPIPYKSRIWFWLHELYPSEFDGLELQSKVLTEKKYFRRMMFSKSGYLPEKIRKMKSLRN